MMFGISQPQFLSTLENIITELVASFSFGKNVTIGSVCVAAAIASGKKIFLFFSITICWCHRHVRRNLRSFTSTSPANSPDKSRSRKHTLMRIVRELEIHWLLVNCEIPCLGWRGVRGPNKHLRAVAPISRTQLPAVMGGLPLLGSIVGIISVWLIVC